MAKSASHHPRPRFNRSAFLRVIKLVAPYRGTFILALIALAAGSGLNLAFPEIIRHIINAKLIDRALAHGWLVAIAIIGFFSLQGLAFYFRTYLFGLVGQRVVSDLRSQLYRVIVEQGLEFFDKSRAGDLVSRLSTDTQMLQDAVSTRLSILVRYSFQIVCGLILMVSISLRLTLAILLVLPAIIVVSAVMGKKLKALSKSQQTELGNATEIANETINAARIVKAFNREAFEFERYDASNTRVLNWGIKRSSFAAFFASFINSLMNITLCLVVFYGLTLVAAQRLGVGDLSAFLLYGAIVAVSFAFVANGYTEFLQSLGAAERVFELLDLPLVSKLPAPLSVLPEKVLGRVEFREVFFSYPSRPDHPALRNLSFEAEAGKITALVGPSGSGKSTVVNLLLGFYTPQSGAVLFDNHSLLEVDPRQIRQHLALVPQDPQLFGVSIADNLRYGKADATLEELEEACARVNILDFVRALPQGFDTNPGGRAVQLSGGQKQRLAIARALLRNPALILLDEATSALDSDNEHHVYESLYELMRGRTIIIIAHRLATVRRADKIVVINHGTVVQQGRHEELASQTGLYRHLVERQELS